MISAYVLGEWSTYFLFYAFLVFVAVQYIQARKPYMSGLVGLILMFSIAVLFFVYKRFFPTYFPFPKYLSSTPPIALTVCIYYLTFSQKKRHRLLIILAALALLAQLVIYVSAIFFL